MFWKSLSVMLMKIPSLVSLLAIGGALLAPGAVSAVDWKEDVRPILSERCFKCHSGPRAKGKLRMDSESNFAKRIGEGEDAVIVPGDPVKSLLAIKAGLPRSDGDAMPPPASRDRGNEPMTAGELDTVKKWIAAGAHFEAPEPGEGGEEPAGMTEESQEQEFHDWTNHEGKSLKAAFVAAEPGTVVLKSEEGQEIRYPFEKLSEESQTLARKLATAE